MSLPQNLQLSQQFAKCADGQSKELLFYEAKLLDIMKGPMNMLGSTIDNMIHFMYLKAQTPEDHLLVKMLMEKAMAEYIVTAGCLTLIIDDKCDIRADIEKGFNEILKKNQQLQGNNKGPSSSGNEEYYVPKLEPLE